MPHIGYNSRPIDLRVIQDTITHQHQARFADKLCWTTAALFNCISAVCYSQICGWPTGPGDTLHLCRGERNQYRQINLMPESVLIQRQALSVRDRAKWVIYLTLLNKKRESSFCLRFQIDCLDTSDKVRLYKQTKTERNI